MRVALEGHLAGRRYEALVSQGKTHEEAVELAAVGKCPKCGAAVRYDVPACSWVCDACDEEPRCHCCGEPIAFHNHVRTDGISIIRDHYVHWLKQCGSPFSLKQYIETHPEQGLCFLRAPARGK